MRESRSMRACTTDAVSSVEPSSTTDSSQVGTFAARYARIASIVWPMRCCSLKAGMTTERWIWSEVVLSVATVATGLAGGAVRQARGSGSGTGAVGAAEGCLGRFDRPASDRVCGRMSRLRPGSVMPWSSWSRPMPILVSHVTGAGTSAEDLTG